MNELGLNDAQQEKLYERLELQIPNIVRVNATEAQKLRMIGFFVTGTIAALQAELASAPVSSTEDHAKELPFVFLDMEHSPVNGYDNRTLDLLARRDSELRARGLPDDERKRLLSEYEFELVLRMSENQDSPRPNVQPSVLPPHDDTTLTRLAEHDRKLRAAGYPDEKRRMYLETFEAGELLIQSSDRT